MRGMSAALAIAATTAAVVVPAVPAAAATLTVCTHGCAYTQLAPALAAAHDGDTIKVGKGAYAGGVTITKSIKLHGAGASSTVIRGGAPVLTIGTFGASSEPRVALEGVTITGGVTRSSAESQNFVGKSGVFALGGGIAVPPDASFRSGADVTLTNSVVSGNQVAVTATVPSGLSQCPGFPNDMCPFALAGGAGISAWGPLTIRNSTISGNRAGAATSLPGNGKASDVNGAGIWSMNGPTTITSSRVNDNRGRAVAPNGRFVDTGGLLVTGGTTTLRNDTFSGNSARLDAALPNDFTAQDSWLAISGGVRLSGEGATVTNSKFLGNKVVMTNSVGDANAFSGGFHTDMDVTASNIVSSGNSVIARATGSGADAVADSAGGEISGSFTGLRMTGNTVAALSKSGLASALAGALIVSGTMIDATVRANTVRASAAAGRSFARGGGVMVGDGVSIRNSRIVGNVARVDSAHGAAKGGGIYDGPAVNGPPGGPLTVVDSRITGNTAAGPSASGGGIFASGQAVSRIDSVVRGNRPDQCVGC